MFEVKYLFWLSGKSKLQEPKENKKSSITLIKKKKKIYQTGIMESNIPWTQLRFNSLPFMKK